MPNETYLGDGLYASHDGFSFILRAPRDGGDHSVYLEPEVLEDFLRFVAKVVRVNIQIQSLDPKDDGPGSLTIIHAPHKVSHGS